MSKIFWRSSFVSRFYVKGWYYKYKNYEGGPYDTEKLAETALMVRLLDTKPKRGRSDPNTVKP